MGRLFQWGQTPVKLRAAWWKKLDEISSNEQFFWIFHPLNNYAVSNKFWNMIEYYFELILVEKSYGVDLRMCLMKYVNHDPTPQHTLELGFGINLYKFLFDQKNTYIAFSPQEFPAKWCSSIIFITGSFLHISQFLILPPISPMLPSPSPSKKFSMACGDQQVLSFSWFLQLLG